MKKIMTKHAKIILDDEGDGRGSVIVDGGISGYNSSYQWGAMGGTLNKFILSINGDYFARNLCGKVNEFNTKATFAEVRRHIAEEMELPWYEEVYFQKGMRECLNDFQRNCYNEHDFVDGWDSFISSLPFHNLEGRYSDSIEDNFRGICEHWRFISTVPSDEYKWYVKVLKELQTKLKKMGVEA